MICQGFGDQSINWKPLFPLHVRSMAPSWGKARQGQRNNKIMLIVLFDIKEIEFKDFVPRSTANCQSRCDVLRPSSNVVKSSFLELRFTLQFIFDSSLPRKTTTASHPPYWLV